PVRVQSGQIYDHKETLEVRRGGPSYGFLVPNAGAPVKQLLRQQEPWFATQPGKIIGLRGFPSLPNAIWPADQMKPPVVTTENPRKVGRTNAGYILYPLTYRYEFGSADPLTGAPTNW